MMIVDDSSLQKHSQVRWLAVRVGGHLALSSLYQMNRLDNGNGCSNDDSITDM